MSKNQVTLLAQSVINGKPLSDIVREYGYSIAEMVHNETTKQSWVIVKWNRKVR